VDKLEKIGHVAVFCAEAILVVALFWACESALRPDAVRIENDTARSVTLHNCQYSMGTTNPIVVQPGETKSVNAVNACQVHSPEYIGCLVIRAEAFQTNEAIRVSAVDTYVTSVTCAATDAREIPRDSRPGRN
jgi:hypothetical protein